MNGECANPGCKAHATNICTACRGVVYCGKEHQKAHWSAHKPTCVSLREAEKKGFLKVVTQEAPADAKKPHKGAHVFMGYKGYLPNGHVFDSSQSFDFDLGMGQVIRGWDEGVATMSVGEKATLYISSNYAYGPRGAGADIPPNCPIIFDLELIRFD
eukprot:m51a1_g852 hypothetical protein (157) ;mRNA; f:788954-789528